MAVVVVVVVVGHIHPLLRLGDGSGREQFLLPSQSVSALCCISETILPNYLD